MRNTLRVLELLDEASQAYDIAEGDRAIDAALECDPATTRVISDAIQVGNIPDPAWHPEGWREYVESFRGAVANAELVREAPGAFGRRLAQRIEQHDRKKPRR
jgi:hypothetical protein